MRLEKLTALELGAAIRRGEVSIPEVTALALERSRASKGNPFITLTEEQAMARAEGLQKGLRDAESPLYGVPMAIKDNICTRGVKTTCASRMLEGFVPPYSGAVVDLLEHAGTVSVGKANMDEFAMGSTGETSHFGPARNPWDRGRSAGGSSSGSAAAVAEGCCWFALGSDTGGSIRLPAAHCGLTGVRPTYGTVSRYGLIAHASSLDQIGPLCRDAADCAAVLDVIQRQDRRDPTTAPGDYGRLLEGLTGDLRGIRVGIPLGWFEGETCPAVRGAVLSAAEVLKDRGAALVELSLPLPEKGVTAYFALSAAEASSNLARYDGLRYGLGGETEGGLENMYVTARTRGFGAEVKWRILLGAFVLSNGYYHRAAAVRERLRHTFDGVFTRCDALLTPVSAHTAPLLGEGRSNPLKDKRTDIFTVPAGLAGLPALSIPCGFDRAGLPVGAQLIGPRFGEQTLLHLAYGYQRDTDWHRRRPEGGGEG